MTLTINLFGVYVDVDECLSHDCGQVCTNFIGGYNCSCLKGFFLEIDGRSCAGILLNKLYTIATCTDVSSNNCIISHATL